MLAVKTKEYEQQNKNLINFNKLKANLYMDINYKVLFVLKSNTLYNIILNKSQKGLKLELSSNRCDFNITKESKEINYTANKALNLIETIQQNIENIHFYLEGKEITINDIDVEKNHVDNILYFCLCI